MQERHAVPVFRAQSRAETTLEAAGKQDGPRPSKAQAELTTSLGHKSEGKSVRSEGSKRITAGDPKWARDVARGCLE